MQLSPLQSRLAASFIATCLLLAIYFFLLLPQFALALELSSVPPGDGIDNDVERWTLEHAVAEGVDSSETLDLRSPLYEPDFAPFDRSIIGRAPTGVTALVNNAPMNTNLDPGTSATFVFEVTSLSGRETEDKDVAQDLRRGLTGNDSQDLLGELDGKDSETGTESTGSAGDATTHLELLRRQQGTRTLFISANTCLQPQSSGDQTTMDTPQLTLFVSTSTNNTSPGPTGDKDTQTVLLFNEGAVMYNTSLTEDVYFSISAPNISTGFSSRLYNVEVAASIDESYHSYDDASNPNLIWVDSDATATLLTTGNLTTRSDQVLSTPPYTMFAWNQDYTSVRGVRNSYCGLKEYAQIGGSISNLPSDMMTTGMTNRGQGNLTKQEFYFKGLNSSTKYIGVMAQDSGATAVGRRDGVGGGGVIFMQTEFDTKQSGTCTIIFNLTFCDQTAYAVPGNLQKFANVSALASFYDDYAKFVYGNFDKAMQQIPCETVDTAKYSLARGCDDCKAAYKNWLCSVAIPRCEDFSSTDAWLQMRNINALFPDGTPVASNITAKFGGDKAYNSSRVPRIDSEVQPGPYKEVLPCDDLCYDIVQSCPSSLNFNCPLPGMRGFNTSYGHRASSTETNVTCNYPGSAHVASAAALLSVPWITMAGLLMM